MAKNATSEPLVTPAFRLGFPHLFEPREPLNGQGEKKYGITMLFPKGADLEPLKDAVRQVVQAQWPDKGKRPKNIRLPFRDQGEKEQYDGFEAGAIFVNATKTARFGAPGIVNAKNEIVTRVEDAYPGANARAQVVAFAYNTAGNVGVSFGLNHVQIIGGGEPLGNTTRPEDAFEPVAAASGGDAETADDVFGGSGEPGDSVDDILG